jgi:hypothetical protein
VHQGCRALDPPPIKKKKKKKKKKNYGINKYTNKQKPLAINK